MTAHYEINESLSNRFVRKNATKIIPVDFIEDVIEWLEYIKLCPHMYFASETPEGVSAFYWFTQALQMLGYDIDSECNIFQERGWGTNSNLYAHSMKEKGLTEKEMAQEMLAIEIVTWKKLLEKSKRALAQQNNESNDDTDSISKNG